MTFAAPRPSDTGPIACAQGSQPAPKRVVVDVLDPRHDPEPSGWRAFHIGQGLPAPWDYDLLRQEATAVPKRVLLAVARDASDASLVAACAVFVGRLTRFGPTVADLQLSWMSGEPGWVVDTALGEAGGRAAVAALERAVCRRVGTTCVGVIHRNVPSQWLPAIGGPGRRAVATAPTCVLSNDFGSVDGWLASLPSRRRADLRRQQRVLARDGDLVIVDRPARDDLDGHELLALLRHHWARFPARRHDWRAPLTPAYLQSLVRRPDVVTLTYRNGAGRLLAFATMLDSSRTLYLHLWAALQPFEGGRRHLYYDAHVRGVRNAVERGRPLVSSGRGLSEAKEALGFTGRPLYDVAVPRPLCGRVGR